MIDPEVLYEKYYGDNPPLRRILTLHSQMVARHALRSLDIHPELEVDRRFVYEAAMLHDIGIFLTDAPSIHCYGKEHYLCHGLLGGRLLRREGLPRHARVAERHTGTGLTAAEIARRELPLPHQDFLPETVEEKLVCYADKFYSKTRLTEEKPVEQILRGIEKFGPESVDKFLEWHKLFG